jgi:hypothetical protein
MVTINKTGFTKDFRADRRFRTFLRPGNFSRCNS